MTKLGITLILVIASVFVAMKGRAAWYAITGGDAGHDMTSGHRFEIGIRRGSWSFIFGL